ncbi:MAG TPA: ABC transporter substrate-binding protein [Actinomycetota bacterium]|nr:ABC transporter substrate-binding protein [Actinomycetota bacterium]
MRSRRVAALAAIVAMLAVACGNRLPKTAAGGSLLPGETVPTGAAGSPVVPGPGETVAPGGPAAGRDPARGFGARGCIPMASDPDRGVTDSEIKVGTIVARSGPLPGSFYPMTQAIAAYFKKVNDAGGICGRTLRLIVQDDRLNADAHLTAAKKLVESDKVFAIVGMLTAVDKASAAYLCARGVPDVGGFALSYNRAQGEDCPAGKPPVYWSPLGGLTRATIGDHAYYTIQAAEKLGGAGRRGAVMYHSTLDISKDQGLAQQWAVNHAWCRLYKHASATDATASPCDVVASRQDKTYVPDDQLYDVNPVATDAAYDPLVQRMISANVDAVYSSMEINSNIKLLRSMGRYKSAWRQRLGRDPVVYFQLSAYDPKLLAEAAAQALGSYLWIPHVPFTEPQHSVMGDYLSTLAKFFPTAEATSFGAQGWAGAAMFVEAVARAGANLTRESLRAALDSISGYTAGGFVGSLTPRERTIFHCGVVVRVESRSGRTDFYRWRPERDGFLCTTLKRWR